ncbi:P4H3 [Symbiodinium sp. KB8]|nr:P4H3 [Symbiodinium sp. KB8]
MRRLKKKAVEKARSNPKMAMKYLGAYLMAVLGGKEAPDAKDIKAILEAGGISYEDEMIDEACKRMEGKQVAVGLPQLLQQPQKPQAEGKHKNPHPIRQAVTTPILRAKPPREQEEKKKVEEEEEEDPWQGRWGRNSIHFWPPAVARMHGWWCIVRMSVWMDARPEFPLLSALENYAFVLLRAVVALAVVAAAVIAFRLLPESSGHLGFTKREPELSCVGVQPTQVEPAVHEKPAASQPLPSNALQQRAVPEGGEWRVVSQFPRIYVQDGFLSEPECEILKQQVAGRLEPAKVVQKADNQYDEQVSVRNNRQIWLNYTQERDDPDVFHLLKRMHRASRIPDDDAEALQIGHYGVGEKYETHQDSDPRNDVARPATLIVYLNDVEDGGETLFPLGNRHDCTMQWRAAADGSSVFGASACCARSDLLRVSPKKGRAVLSSSQKFMACDFVFDGWLNCRSGQHQCIPKSYPESL